MISVCACAQLSVLTGVVPVLCFNAINLPRVDMVNHGFMIRVMMAKDFYAKPCFVEHVADKVHCYLFRLTLQPTCN